MEAVGQTSGHKTVAPNAEAPNAEAPNAEAPNAEEGSCYTWVCI